MSTRGRRDELASFFGVRHVLNPLARSVFAKADQARDAGNFRDAAEGYARGLRIKPGHWELRVQLGHALKELGDLDGAMDQYLRALESAPKNADLHVQIGHLCRLRGDNVRAAEHYTLASRLGLTDPHAHHFLERLYPPEADLRQQRRVLWLSPESAAAKEESRRLVDIGMNMDVKLLPRDAAVREQLASSGVSLTAYDLVIVAEDLFLFEDVIREYEGGCIFRSYGTGRPISYQLWDLNLRSLVSTRNNVFFAMPSQAAIHQEDGFFVSPRCTVVPRTVPGWAPSKERAPLGLAKNGQTFVRAARASDDLDLLRMRKLIDTHFRGDTYRVVDGEANAIDGLTADDLAALRKCSAALYPYNERGTLHLFAIELLLLEVPMIYFAGTYLSQLIGSPAPGEARTIQEAHLLCERLSGGDVDLRADILKAQARGRVHFDPKTVWPEFERELVAMMARTPITATARRPGEDEARQLAEVVLGSLDAPKQRQPELQKYIVQTLYQAVLGVEPGDADIRKHLLAFQKHGRIDLALRDLTKDDENLEAARVPLLRWLGRKSLRRRS